MAEVKGLNGPQEAAAAARLCADCTSAAHAPIEQLLSSRFLFCEQNSLAGLLDRLTAAARGVQGVLSDL